MASPTKEHWSIAERIMRYLKGTIELGILYQSNKEITNLIAYIDCDFVGDLDDKKQHI